MNAWIEMMVVMGTVAGGVWVGRWMGKGKWWWAGFVGAMGVVTLVIVGHRMVRGEFLFPFSWAVWPRVGPMAMGLAIPLMMSVLMMKLPERRKRVMVGILMGVMVGYFAVMPLAGPLIVRGNLLSGETKIGRDGVCFQTHVYSCGPAAAVTCLGVLGVKGEEGAIAAAAWSGPGLGANGRMLAEAINHLYEAAGIHGEYRFVGTLEELRVPAVVSIWSPQYGGHYVAMLEVGKDFVVVGDPLSGRQRRGRGEFLGEWSGAGVEITRD